MLAHSPPLPLTIDYRYGDLAMDEELEGSHLAFKHSDRVRRIRFQLSGPVPSMERLMAAIDKEFRMLEHLYISLSPAPRLNWSLPSTLCAPQLRHLELFHFTFPIGCPLPAGLVTLTLEWIRASADLDPNELLQQLSLLTRLETLIITFDPPPDDQDVERQLLQTPLSTHTTLPSLRSFIFEGPLLYIKSVLPQITMPFLKVADIKPPAFFDGDLAFPASLVLQFLYKMENPRFRDVRVTFNNLFVVMTMYPHEGTGMPALRMRVGGRAIAVGLELTVRRFREMGAVFSEVESLTLEDKTPQVLRKHSLTNLHELLGLFTNVRTLHAAGGDLIEILSHVLQPHEGGSAVELLPMLSVVSCPEDSYIGESCRSFLTARRGAGFLVTIAHHRSKKASFWQYCHRGRYGGL